MPETITLSSNLLILVGALALLLLAIGAAWGRRRANRTVLWTEQPRTLARNRDDTGSVEDDPDVRAFIQNNRMIDAIKLVRDRTGLGLRESKELVERMRAQLPR